MHLLLPGLILMLPPEPSLIGDPEAALHLEGPLQAALEATEGFGPWPAGPWRVHLHEDGVAFEQATGAPPQRAAAWVGSTLHLRPWLQLTRREVGAVLRHELTHRRLLKAGLPRWEEEARCLWAETHTAPPAQWPTPPSAGLRDRLDRALARGTTAEQAWAYRSLRAWLRREDLVLPQAAPAERGPAWEDVPAPPVPLETHRVTVCWPPERLPARLVVQGRELPKGVHRFQGTVSFGKSVPVGPLEGEVEARWRRQGWEIRWTVPVDTWIAAATAGELGEETPFEARRALAAVLRCWIQGRGQGHHQDGSLCPLTHCAVVRGQPSRDTLQAAGTAPRIPLDPAYAFFTGSAGGHLLSPREVWGRGPSTKGQALEVPGDRWARWARQLTPAQVEHLKRSVPPGLKPGQRGLHLGASGPYPAENLRLAAGRAFGWTLWPSNVCEGESLPDGGIRLKGRGWGHNAGLCLVTAIARAKAGWKAEAILAEAFGAPAAEPAATPIPGGS